MFEAIGPAASIDSKFYCINAPRIKLSQAEAFTPDSKSSIQYDLRYREHDIPSKLLTLFVQFSSLMDALLQDCPFQLRLF